MLDDALRISFRHETTGTTGDLWRCWKMGRGKKQEERNRRGVRGKCPIRAPGASAASVSSRHQSERDHRRQRAGTTGCQALEYEHRGWRASVLSYRLLPDERFRQLITPAAEK